MVAALSKFLTAFGSQLGAATSLVLQSDNRFYNWGMSMSIIEGYLTPTEAAKRLGKSHPSICRYIREGILPAVTDRGRKYIPIAAVEGFQEPQKGNPNFRRKKTG